MSDSSELLQALRSLLELTVDPAARTSLAARIAQLQAQERSGVSFSGSQMGDVSVGAVAGGNITTIAQQNQIVVTSDGQSATELARMIQQIGRSRPYSNLGAPPYANFIMRRAVYEEVLDALRQRNSIVLIHGFAGNGKTSLAYEIASNCRKGLPGIQAYEAVVWVSDQGAPSSTTLKTVLDEIARTIDYPGASGLEPAQKQLYIEDILRTLRVLLVMDSFETVTDQPLIEWLQRLPEPSKALVTSREARSNLMYRSLWPVPLKGMSVEEAQALIVQRLTSLGLGAYTSNLSPFEPVLRLTECSPKAIEMVLGQLKHGRGLKQIIDDLQRGQGDLFTLLFARSWSLLEESARHILMAASIFPASVTGDALEIVAAVGSYHEYVSLREKLIDMGLLERRPLSLDEYRYSLHSLVRTFADAQCKQRPDWTAEAQRRWITWAGDFAANAGWPDQDLRRLNVLDQEDDEAIVYAALGLARTRGLSHDVVRIAKGVDHYYYVRGIWDKKFEVDRWRIEAARALGDCVEEGRSIAQYVQILSNRAASGDLIEAERWIPSLSALMEDPALTPLDQETASVQVQMLHAFAFYYRAVQRYDEARRFLEQSRAVSPAPEPKLTTATLRWLGLTLYSQGLLDEARQVFEEALAMAEANNDARGTVNCRIGLAKIYIDQDQLALANPLVDEALAMARNNGDRRYIAQAQLERARLAVAQGNAVVAQEALKEADELFRRLLFTADSERLYDTEQRLRLLVEPGQAPEV